MEHLSSFQLQFVSKETHLLLPLVYSIRLAQNLYDALFQYAVTPQKEALLEAFIKDLERHIKSKSTAPYSQTLSELDFLEEGLEELQLLNWSQVPVYAFRLQAEDSESIWDIVRDLENIMVCAWRPERQLLYVYPHNFV